MSTNDHTLGLKVHTQLQGLGIETPCVVTAKWDAGAIYDAVGESYERIMGAMGLDDTDDSLAGTPGRIAKMYAKEIFYGLDYTNFPKATVVSNKMHYDEMISCKATVMSMCEHHFVPFIGVAHVAYVPRDKVIGLSKMNRVVDFFSRRPQVQERLTVQIAHTLELLLETHDVAVVIQAEHLCVKLRGVKDQNSSTTTSKMMGKFMTNHALRSEFLALTRSGPRFHCD